MRELERGTVVRIADPSDQYAGLTGTVIGEYLGMLTGAPMVEVRLEGRDRWDTEGFYLGQVERLEVAA